MFFFQINLHILHQNTGMAKKVLTPEQQIIKLKTDKGIAYKAIAAIMGVSSTHLNFQLFGKGDLKRPILPAQIKAINKEYQLDIPLPKAS